MNVSRTIWGRYEGRDVFLFRLENGNMDVLVSSFGATITGINIPDKNGVTGNVVLHYDTLQEYVDDEYYVGSVVGRFAGRVSKARVEIEGQSYELSPNGGDALHLHGGYSGFNKKNFSAIREVVGEDAVSVELYYRSPDLEEGYPGNLDLIIVYELDRFNRLSIKYKAVSDHDTPINLTNHSYFNFGDHEREIFDHKVRIDADRFVVSDAGYIPTGKITPVVGTPYSFKDEREIGRFSYNECFVLNRPGLGAASVYHHASGRKVALETDFPALLFYTGKYLGGKFAQHTGLCLETQFYPDSPNQPGFPNTILRVGEVWEHYTTMRFSW